MCFRMLKTAKNDISLMTQFPLKLQCLILLSSPHRAASALPCSSSMQNSTALELRSIAPPPADLHRHLQSGPETGIGFPQKLLS